MADLVHGGDEGRRVGGADLVLDLDHDRPLLGRGLDRRQRLLAGGRLQVGRLAAAAAAGASAGPGCASSTAPASR